MFATTSPGTQISSSLADAAAMLLSAIRALSIGGLGALAGSAARPAILRRSAGISMAGGLPVAIEAPIALTAASIEPSEASAPAWSGDLLVVPFWQADDASSLELTAAQAEIDSAYDGALTDVIAQHEFSGKPGSSAVVALPRGSSARRLAIVGLGKADAFKVSGATKLGGALATMAKEQKAVAMAAALPSDAESPLSQPTLQQAVVEAALLGLSPDTRYKSDKDADDNKPPKLESLELLGGAVSAAAVARARTMAAGVLLTKGLVGSPANYLTPTTMAQTAEGIAKAFPSVMQLKVLERKECERLGMGAYLGVSQGAVEPPKFIHLAYRPAGGKKASKRVALVGKGLTFDSGGYNIKAGAGSMIEKMKFDMGGAGAVLGAARVLAEVRPEGVETHFIIASCENMVSAEAMRPGDILTASNQKTIEVLEEIDG